MKGHLTPSYTIRSACAGLFLLCGKRQNNSVQHISLHIGCISSPGLTTAACSQSAAPGVLHIDVLGIVRMESLDLKMPDFDELFQCNVLPGILVCSNCRNKSKRIKSPIFIHGKFPSQIWMFCFTILHYLLCSRMFSLISMVTHKLELPAVQVCECNAFDLSLSSHTRK